MTIRRLVPMIAALVGVAPLAGQHFDRSAVRDAAISPDAALVAFTLREPAADRDAFVERVYRVGANGGDARLIGDGRRPAFAPVGTAFARLVPHGGGHALVVRDSLPLDDRPLSGDGLDVAAFRWSPDGQRIAFAASRRATLGRAISLDRRLAIYVVEAAGGEPRRLTGDDFAVGPRQPELDGLPQFDWLDGARLVVSGREASGNEHREAASLFVVQVASGARRYLVGTGGRWQAPVVSPNGEWIAFTGQALGPAGWMASELIVIRPDATGLRRLTVGFDRDVLDLAWADDSRTIWFAAEDRGTRNLNRVDARNGRITAGTSGTHLMLLQGLSARGDWALAIRSTATNAGTLIRFPLNRPHEWRILAEPADAPAVGEVEELDLAGADGTQLHGWLHRPGDFDPARRYPLLVEVHGGPHAMAGAGYAPHALAHAASGRLVLRLNPRGSTGFGFDIANGLGDRWPGADVDDLRAAITALVDRGLVDSTRIAVAGTGAGALTAAALARRDPRIRVAILRCPAAVGAPWHEWHAARGLGIEAIEWWREWVRRPEAVVPDAAFLVEESGVAPPWWRGALPNADTRITLPGRCDEAGPETQRALFDAEINALP